MGEPRYRGGQPDSGLDTNGVFNPAGRDSSSWGLDLSGGGHTRQPESNGLDDALERTAKKQPLLRVKLTAYHLLTMLTIAGFGIPKAILTYQGRSAMPTTFDLVLGVVLALVFYWVGLYESIEPPVMYWLLHRDLAPEILFWPLRYVLKFLGYWTISVLFWFWHLPILWIGESIFHIKWLFALGIPPALAASVGAVILIVVTIEITIFSENYLPKPSGTISNRLLRLYLGFWIGVNKYTKVGTDFQVGCIDRLALGTGMLSGFIFSSFCALNWGLFGT